MPSSPTTGVLSPSMQGWIIARNNLTCLREHLRAMSCTNPAEAPLPQLVVFFESCCVRLCAYSCAQDLPVLFTWPARPRPSLGRIRAEFCRKWLMQGALPFRLAARHHEP